VQPANRGGTRRTNGLFTLYWGELPFIGYFCLANQHLSLLCFKSMLQKTIRLVIVEDELLMAKMLGVWMTRQQDFEVIGYAQDGEAGLSLCESTKPDLALMDIALPKLDGLHLVKKLRPKFPKLRLLMMSGLTDPYTIWRVLQSGVHGYIDKLQPPEVLIEAIRTVAGGNSFFSPVFQEVKADWLSQPEAFQKILSDREQEVLRRVVVGLDDENIAAELEISASTVATHRKHIRQKLGAHNDRDLMAYARKWGLNTAKI
jgi:DNA-binding NarL/FixJ family response regulator